MTALSLARRAALCLPFAFLVSPALADTWTVDHDNSRLAFVAMQNGAPVEGVFSDWSTDITLDPADLASARIEARVRTGSATTGQAQVDGTLPGTAWFDVASTPEAVFTSSRISATGDNTYEASGELMIKGVSKSFVLPFTLEIKGDTAHATAEVPLARTDYSVGSDIATGTVADEVKVVLDIAATR